MTTDQQDDQAFDPSVDHFKKIPSLFSRSPGCIGAEPAMTNIVNLRTRSSAKVRSRSTGASALLATVACGLTQIGRTDFKSKEDLQQALLFIALSNTHLRKFVDQIKDDEGRARMTAQTDRIEQLVEDAGRKAAAL